MESLPRPITTSGLLPRLGTRLAPGAAEGALEKARRRHGALLARPVPENVMEHVTRNLVPGSDPGVTIPHPGFCSIMLG